MTNEHFYYDATGFNTLDALAGLVARAANGEVVAGSDEWRATLLEMPVDSLAQFKSVEFTQLRLEEVIRENQSNSAQLEELRALGNQAVVDLHELHRPGNGDSEPR